MNTRISVEHEPSGLYISIEQTDDGEWTASSMGAPAAQNRQSEGQGQEGQPKTGQEQAGQQQHTQETPTGRAADRVARRGAR